MRLSALNPTLEDGDGWTSLSFACPAHGVGHMRHAQPELEPPFEGFPDVVSVRIFAPLDYTPHERGVWGWNGERDFEKLTLTPSIDYNGHWHGHVTDGEVSTVVP